MKVVLSVIAGPHAGREFAFDGRDSFLVGRSKDAHFQLPAGDPYFSRRHFVIELNPPRCRLLDLKSRNGVLVNGRKVSACELQDGDEVQAGDTTFLVSVSIPDPDSFETLDLPARAIADATIEFQPRPPVASGLSVPGYRLEEKLGHGGMGVVYRGVRLADGAAAAVKVITPAAGMRAAAERFLREARILGQLQHPHVVRFLEAGEAGEKLFIAMELVEGPNAAQMTQERGGSLSVRTAVRILCQALTGLAHAHAAGFVHRDVKPHNLLIGRAGGKRVVKVADFGMARAYEASRLSGMTLHGEVGGTPAFMAPEQITHYRDAKPAADQYAAAATLYYMLTGTYAFDFPDDMAARLVMILTETPVPIHLRRPDLPVELAGVIHRAMAYDAAERFPDMSAFHKALRPFGV